MIRGNRNDGIIGFAKEVNQPAIAFVAPFKWLFAIRTFGQFVLVHFIPPVGSLLW
jgi:hypothetical protein